MPIILQHFLYLTFSNKKLEDTNSATAWPTLSPDWNVMPFCEWSQVYYTIWTTPDCRRMTQVHLSQRSFGQDAAILNYKQYLLFLTTKAFWAQRNAGCLYSYSAVSKIKYLKTVKVKNMTKCNKRKTVTVSLATLMKFQWEATLTLHKSHLILVMPDNTWAYRLIIHGVTDSTYSCCVLWNISLMSTLDSIPFIKFH